MTIVVAVLGIIWAVGCLLVTVVSVWIIELIAVLSTCQIEQKSDRNNERTEHFDLKTLVRGKTLEFGT